MLEYTAKFDGVVLTRNNIQVTPDEISAAYSQLTTNQLAAIREAISRVRKFYSKQKVGIKDTLLKSEEGTTTLRWLPIKRAGIYAPAGRAPLPSSVLMAALPAKLAGAEELVLCSPPQKDGNINPAILVAANECGVTEIYKIGGAQAIAALAYSCELFDKVDIISGPGNVYVSYAKQLVVAEGTVKIDAIAGPSEIVIIADETGDAEILASDMLAQAEHGTNSSSILVTTSEKLAGEVNREVKQQLSELLNNETATASLQNFGAILIAKNTSEAISFVNYFAPEHVEIFTKDADTLSKSIVNAGAVFIRTGEVFGDYGMTGSNHILPTGGAARFSSGVSVYTFMKYQMVEELSKKEQVKIASITAEFARLEQLEAHANSAEKRKINSGETYD